MLQRLLDITKSNQLLIFIDQGLVSGVNFLMAILLARFLGLTDFGLFAFGWMLVLFVSSIQLAFIISPLFTLFPKHNNPNGYITSLHIIQVGFSIITLIISILVVLVSNSIKPEWFVSGVIYSLPLAASLFVMQDFYRRVNITKKNPLNTLISDAIAYGLQPILIVVLHHFNELNIHTTYLSISGLFLCSVIFNITKVGFNLNVQTIKKTITENWSFSKYLVGTALLQWVSGNFFIIVAGGLLGPVAIGAVRIAQNIVGVLHVLFSAMENIIPIKGAEILTQKGAKAAVQYFKKMMLQGGLITLLVLMTIAIFGKFIINLFYGPEYLQHSNVLLGFTGVYVLVFTGTLLGFVIRTFEVNQIFLWSYVATTFFSLIAAKPIIHQLGVYGVIVGLFATQVISISFYLIKLKSKLNLLWK